MSSLRRLLTASALAGAIILAAAPVIGIADAYEPQAPPYLGEQEEHPPGAPPPQAQPEEEPPSGAEAHHGPPRIEKSPVIQLGRQSGHTVRVYVRGGYCDGEPPPSIERINIHEHRLPGESKLAAVIIAFLRRPAPLEFPDETQSSSAEGPQQSVPNCAGVEHVLYRRVALRHLPDELEFFDGSQSPPSRIPAA